MSESVADTVQTLFVQIMKLSTDEVSLDADLFAVYGLDSLRAVKLLSNLEVEYDILFPDEDVRNIRTLRDVIVLVDRVRKLEGENA